MVAKILDLALPSREISNTFHGLKITKLILKLVPGASFASAKTISAFVDTDLQLMMKMLGKSNSR